MLVLVLTLGLLAGCGSDEGSGDTGSGSASAAEDGLSKADVIFYENGAHRYSIVRQSGSDNSKIVSGAGYIYKQAKNIFGSNIKNDFDTVDDTDKYEILVGNTNREESQKALDYLFSVGGRYDDYIICTIGKKIVINSENLDKLEEACRFFVDNYFKTEGVKGGILYTLINKGDFEELTVNGVNIGNYDFVRPHYNSSYLTELQMESAIDEIYKQTGYKLSITHDTKTAAKRYEIIVGNAERDGVTPVTDDYNTFSINVKGEKVYLNGGSAHATAMAVSEFAKMLLKGNVTDANSTTGNYETALKSYDLSITYRKTWGDDFDGTELDRSKWFQETETNRTEGHNGKTSVRSTNPNDVFVKDGKFYICARQDDEYYYGGMIKTHLSMSFRYGYVEMSTVLPQGNGFWVALWSGTNDTVEPISGEKDILYWPEIDMVECFGNSTHYAGNCHAWPSDLGKQHGLQHFSLDGTYGNEKKYVLEDEGVVLGDGFHTYGFVWDIRQMGFVCDGDFFFSYDITKNDRDITCFNKSLYLILSMATGFKTADIPTTDPDEWANTNKLIVDWINVYQKNDGLSELILH